ncbi:MAG TPA: hypothetical protein VFB96_08745 [Pirellulaceae bacterium]|nr:hypothetical protein [Pirellulaceae bacterium]
MRFHVFRLFPTLVVLFGTAAVLAAGCNLGPSFKLTPVSGTVKMNGQPLPDADVQFVYDGTPPEEFLGSMGKTDANGKYELTTNKGKGTIDGKFKVIVSKYTDKSGNPVKENLEGGIDLQQLIQSGDAIQAVPPQYSDITQTKETAQVVSGTPLVKDIDIVKQ